MGGATASLLLLVAACGCSRSVDQTAPLRVGYVSNITHAQALVGLSQGTFQRALGATARIDPMVFNAGPSAIEALFAGDLDLSYIGPGPAINGYVKSNGEALRVIAGSASGGAVLVARADAGAESPEQLSGKRVATPQLGNTQDIALRYYLTQHHPGSGGARPSVEIIPMQNADILTAFLRREIDAAWVPEPWGARLRHEAQGRLLLDERTLWPRGVFPTTVLVASTRILRERPHVVAQWLEAHVDVTEWIVDHPDQAKALVNEEFARLTGKRITPAVLDEAWSRLAVTYDPMGTELAASAEHAFRVGFLGKTQPDVTELCTVTLLNAVLAKRHRAAVTCLASPDHPAHDR